CWPACPTNQCDACCGCPAAQRCPRLVALSSPSVESGRLRDLHSFPTRRSSDLVAARQLRRRGRGIRLRPRPRWPTHAAVRPATRSEEHTSELQSRENLVCRLLLENT